jgi:hypothetical protein
MGACECGPTSLLSRFAEELRRVGRLKCVKVALRRSVSTGSLSFLLRQGFGERVGGLSECVKVVLSVEVRAQAFSERPLPQLRDTLTRGFWIRKSKQDEGKMRL